MANYEIIDPSDPVTIAEPFAERLAGSEEFAEFDLSDNDEHQIGLVNHALQKFNLLSEYEVRTNFAYVLPEEMVLHDDDSNVKKLFKDTHFSGELIGSRPLKIGNPIGVRAVCLAFNDTKIMSYISKKIGPRPVNEDIPNGWHIYVPVFAVGQIEQIA